MRKILSYGTADQMLSAFEQRIAVLEDSQDASVQSATSVKGVTRRSNFSRGTADQMLEAFESKIIELEGPDVESSTAVEAAIVRNKNHVEVESNVDNVDAFVPVLVHAVNEELEELDIFDSWTWEQKDSHLTITTVKNSDVHEYSIPYEDLQMNEEDPEEDVQYIMQAITEEGNDSVTSATKIEADNRSVVIPESAKTKYYQDIGGGFGDTDAVYSLEDLMIIWNSECNSDPTMSQYESFNDWWQDTKQWMKPSSKPTEEIDDEIFADNDEVESNLWEELESKQVQDSDGFYTDYTLYKNRITGEYVCVFGDKDVYRPEDGEYDYECDHESEAYEWFESYNGFEDDVYSATKIQGVASHPLPYESFGDDLTPMFNDCPYDVIDAGYTDDGEVIVTLNHQVRDVESAARDIGSILDQNGIHATDWDVNGSNVFLFPWIDANEYESMQEENAVYNATALYQNPYTEEEEESKINPSVQDDLV